MRAVGVNIDSNLKFDQHIQTKVNKANQIVELIRRSFRYIDFKTFCLLFKALVRPHLEYAGCIWNLYLKKDIEAIENVQRRATKMLPYLKELPYDERLKRLKLPTLRLRRLRGDMIETYKTLNKIYDERVTFTLFSLNSSNITRGHSLKLVKNRCRTETRNNFFTNRVVDVWNSLPNSIVTAKNVEIFKRRLDKHWCHHPMIYDYEAKYNVNINSGSSKSLISDDESEPNIEEQADLLHLEQT